MNKVWFDEAWEDDLCWQTQDRKTLRRINALLRDIQRDSFDGIGKPEPPRGSLTGMWSRRIDERNRTVYYRKEDAIYLLSCRGTV